MLHLFTYYHNQIPPPTYPNMSKDVKSSSTNSNTLGATSTGDQSHFENLPVLKKLSPSSTGQRIQGKVVIVTG